MSKLKLKRRELRALGYTNGKTIGIAVNVMTAYHGRDEKEEALSILEQIIQSPSIFLEHEKYGAIAKALLPYTTEGTIPLEESVKPFNTFGANHIDQSAIEQMNLAMRLPVAIEGALMADAHHGYGLPIGGVLATEHAIIPYGVGVDIGCRMCLSVYPMNTAFINSNREVLKGMLQEHTRFGREAFDRPMDDEVLSRSEFKEIPIVKKLRQKAREQIGTSGSGNHFVEFGVVKISDAYNGLEIPEGEYLAVLSHSGSRGLGANIANYYTKLAIEQCRLPKEAKHLAWLDLDTEEGIEYWKAMSLAGDYASACHNHIHHRLSKALGEQPLLRVENHHNFAWKEKMVDGRELIVHRKGATPAGKGILGIIPGSMIAPGYIVRGTGNIASLSSASHGAGRQMSRRKALQRFRIADLRKQLKEHGVELIGGGLDEAPGAYKDIREVMTAQSHLVDILGIFQPKIVRMDKG